MLLIYVINLCCLYIYLRKFAHTPPHVCAYPCARVRIPLRIGAHTSKKIF
nr:MAG TPA: hypothetical protein [Caudoviricetes sp.]